MSKSNVISLSLGVASTNCYIYHREGKAIIIDPGAEGLRIKQALADNGLTPTAILLTHGHFDHIGAVDELKARYGISAYASPYAASMAASPYKSGGLDFIGESITAAVDNVLEATISLAPLPPLEVISTPGHTPGCVSFYSKGDGLVFSGDALFQGSYGRTDLPYGDIAELVSSINKLFALPPNTVVYSGHGGITTIEAERRHNPIKEVTI